MALGKIDGLSVTLTKKEALGLAGLACGEFVAVREDNLGMSLKWAALLSEDKEDVFPSVPGHPNRHLLEQHRVPIMAFLERQGFTLDAPSLDLFAGAYATARKDALHDLIRRSRGDYGPSAFATRYPPPPVPKVEALSAYDAFAKESGHALATNEKWRPIIIALIKFLGHDDLARLTAEDLVRWKDKLLLVDKKAPTTVQDGYLAAVRGTCQYMVDQLKLKENVAEGIVVHGVKKSKADGSKGFNLADAVTILTATLIPPSNKVSAETAAARRWIPWICAYTGARVNEITSLLPSDFKQPGGYECIVLREEMTKSGESRIIPIHEHLLEQGLLLYVEQRRKLGKPLFYDPARARGSDPANPHYAKVGERLAEWVRALPVDHSVWPNHGWRHWWKSLSRHLPMHPEVADFIVGHGGDSVSKRYGDKWVATLSDTIAMLPRYDIAELKIPLSPQKRREIKSEAA
jgi:integrase